MDILQALEKVDQSSFSTCIMVISCFTDGAILIGNEMHSLSLYAYVVDFGKSITYSGLEM